MKRRHVIIGGLAIAGTAVYVSRPSTPAFSHIRSDSWGRGEVDTKVNARISGGIDVNHEVISPFMNLMSDESWSPESALAWMDQQEITSSLLSVSPTLFNNLTQRGTAEAHRRCNEYLAEQVSNNPKRFGLMASLPVTNSQESLAELNYALDELQADGIMLASSNNGVFLGEPQFEALMHELNRRKVSVLVKPGRHPTSDQLALTLPNQLVEQPCDITRAAVNMIFKGTLEKYPDIRWILSNGGGFLPFVAWRLSLANMMPELTENAPQGVLNYLQRFWIETSRSYNPVAMAVLGELFDASKVLFGSGYPSPTPTTELRNIFEQWPQRLIKGVHRHHALSLFPRLADPGEALIPVAQYSRQSSLGKFKDMTFKPLQDFAQSLRD